MDICLYGCMDKKKDRGGGNIIMTSINQTIDQSIDDDSLND